jgi:hypothetical protein
MEEYATSSQPEVTPASSSAPPSNYLVGAILATLFCCQPFGIVSIIYAAQVNSKWQAGDVEGARQYSKNALIWILVSAGIGFVAVCVAMIIAVTAAFFGNAF